MPLAFPRTVKYINRKDKPERIFASDAHTRQLVDVTPPREALIGDARLPTVPPKPRTPA